MENNTNSPFSEGLEDRSTVLKIIEFIIIAALNILSLCGNLSVCWIIYRCLNLRTVPNLFVLSLAITDICVSVLVMPLTLTTMRANGWILGDMVCKLQGYLMLTLGMISLLTLTGIAVNRYFVIVKSIIYKHMFTRRRTITFLVSIWLFSICVCSVPLYLESPSYSYASGKASCFFPFESNLVMTLVLEIVFIGIPLNIMLFCYYKVFREVRRTKRRINVGWRENQKGIGPTREELRLTRTLTFVLIGFCACWLPVSVIDLLDLYYGGHVLPRQLYFLYTVLLYTSSTINPFIYSLSSRQFSTEYRRLFTHCRLRFRDESTTTTTNESPSAETIKVPDVILKTACTGLDIMTSHDLSIETTRPASQNAAQSKSHNISDIATSSDFNETTHTLKVVVHSRPRTSKNIATSYRAPSEDTSQSKATRTEEQSKSYELEIVDKTGNLQDNSMYDLL